eukprot:805353_1
MIIVSRDESLNQYKASVAGLKTRLEESDSHVESLKSKLDTLRQSDNEKTVEIERLYKELRECVADVAKLQRELQCRLATSSCNEVELARQLAARCDEVREAAATSGKLTAELDAVKSLNVALCEQLETVKCSLKKVTTESQEAAVRTSQTRMDFDKQLAEAACREEALKMSIDSRDETLKQ